MMGEPDDVRERIRRRALDVRWLQGHFRAGECVERMSRSDIQRILSAYRSLMRAGSRLTAFELGMLDGYASALGV